MAVGDFAIPGTESPVAFRQETTYGTFALTTTALHPFVATSIGVKTEFETQKLDELSRQRGFTRQVQLDKKVGGPVEGFFHAEESIRLLINAMGGRYTFNSLTSAGDHSISTGNFSASDTCVSLSMYAGKGNQHAWRYAGGVVDTLKISANVGEPVKITAEMVFQDSSLSAADTAPAAVMSVSTIAPFTYVDGVFRYAAVEGSLTSTLNEPIQGFELEIKNNLMTGPEARQLGSRILSRRPPATRREVSLKVTQRFDTTTAFDRFVSNTGGSVQLFFSGASITAEYNREARCTLPNVRFKGAEPLVEGANAILSSDIEFDILVSGDSGTLTSREIGWTIRNGLTTAI